MYLIPYEAEFECPKGHHFTARVGAFAAEQQAMCPICYREWIAANVPSGRQISVPRMVPDGVAEC